VRGPQYFVIDCFFLYGERTTSLTRCHVDLKGDFQGQLALSRVVRLIKDRTETGIADCGVRRAQDRMIESVFGFKAQLQVHSFMHVG
jgi:hypothetical protein